MSLLQDVVRAIRAKGEASIDELHFAGASRDQVQKAMQNAKTRGLIIAVRHRQRGQHKGRMGSVYVAAEIEPPRGDYGIPRISSVWDLGGQNGAQT
jgi:hypothetical protein